MSWLLSKSGSFHMPVLGVRSSEIFWFPDYNWKTLCPINLKLNRVTGHHPRLAAFKIGTGPCAHFGLALIQNVLVSRLEDALSDQFGT